MSDISCPLPSVLPRPCDCTDSFPRSKGCNVGAGVRSPSGTAGPGAAARPALRASSPGVGAPCRTRTPPNSAIPGYAAENTVMFPHRLLLLLPAPLRPRRPWGRRVGHCPGLWGISDAAFAGSVPGQRGAQETCPSAAWSREGPDLSPRACGESAPPLSLTCCYTTCKAGVVGRMLAPNTHLPIPGKKDFAAVIGNRESGRCPGSPRWARCKHKGPRTREVGGSEPEPDTCRDAEFGDEATSLGARATSRCWKGQWTSPVEPPEEPAC